MTSRLIPGFYGEGYLRHVGRVSKVTLHSAGPGWQSHTIAARLNGKPATFKTIDRKIDSVRCKPGKLWNARNDIVGDVVIYVGAAAQALGS